jgi:LIVCS family branched-chain amino acid:cation transporter
VTELGRHIFPLFDLGMGWIIPSIIGLIAGLVITAVKKKAA